MQKRDLIIGISSSLVTVIALVLGGFASFSRPSSVDRAAETKPTEVSQQDRGTENTNDVSAALAAQPATRPAGERRSDKELDALITDYQNRIAEIERQKADLEANLRVVEAELNGGAQTANNNFDLTKEDWAALAKEGKMKYKLPCIRPPGWKIGQAEQNALGLDPAGAEAFQKAFSDSNARLHSTVEPMCAELVGDINVAKALGTEVCVQRLLDAARSDGSLSQAIKQVGSIRAGTQSEPQPGDSAPRAVKLLLALTGELPSFERSLASHFGSEEAHRLTHSEELCSSWSMFQ